MRVEASQLQQIYSRFPSLKVNADKGALEVAAEKVLGAPAAKALLKTLADKDTYLQARSSALDALVKTPEAQPQQQQPKRAVVSGLSSGGIMSAIVLAKAGYHVDAIELREGYTRNMQFSSRQALIDELASIDPKLGEKFLEISSHMSKGNVFTSAKGERKEVTRDAPVQGDPTKVPHSGEELLSGVPMSLVECKALETMLFDYLKKMPNVEVHHNATVEMGGPDDQGRFSVVGKPVARKGQKAAGEPFDLGKPDLVIVSEGSGSKTRDQLHVKNVVTSPDTKFIGGIVDKGLGGRGMSRRDDYKRADGSVDRIITMALGSAKLDRTWVLAEVRPDVNLDPAGLDPTTDAYKQAQQTLIEQELRKEAALVMETDLSGVAVHGPFEGSKAALFTLHQTMSDRAVAGSNVIGLGDFVGTGHFTVGGGMATATVSHIERLKNLVFDMEAGADKGAALAKYNQGALEDTLAWGRRGIGEFYPEVDSKTAGDAYVKAVMDWINGKNDDPLVALDKMLSQPGASQALPAIGKAA